MKDKLKLKIIRFWLEDHPRNVSKIPNKLKKKINRQDITNLMVEIVDLDIAGLEDYKRTLESHISQKKNSSYKREIIIVIITIIITAIVSNIDRIINYFK